VVSSLTPLPADLFQVPELAYEPCAARDDDEVSSLVASGPDGLPPSPEGPLPVSSRPSGSIASGADEVADRPVRWAALALHRSGAGCRWR